MTVAAPRSRADVEGEIRALFGEWSGLASEGEASLRKVRYSGPVFGAPEYDALLDAVFAGWWSGGRFTIEAERKLAAISDRNHAVLFNSGSSANLALMLAARERYFQSGDKILTLSCGFPTTVNAIITAGLVPVFVDIDLAGLAISPEVVADALKADPAIRGIFVAHTLGFPANVRAITETARANGVEVFYDCCDAYGTEVGGRPLAAFGKAATFSFYVAHHATCGEGGGVVTNDPELHAILRGIRSWGRYCAAAECCVRAEHPESFCPPARLSKDADLPEDYAVNYQYEWLGQNLKPLEIQSSILSVQLGRLAEFNEARRRNYATLLDAFRRYERHFKLWDLPPGVSPFAFPVLLDDTAPFKRKHLVDHFSRSRIETRLLFGGNLSRHPAYRRRPEAWEMLGGPHGNADAIVDRFFMIGVAPVVTPERAAYVVERLDAFMAGW